MSDHGHEHHRGGGHRSTKEYALDFVRNWRTYEGPLAEKLLLTARNRFKATFLPPLGCCGHRGEPGC